jgi:hypothetical protein
LNRLLLGLKFDEIPNLKNKPDSRKAKPLSGLNRSGIPGQLRPESKFLPPGMAEKVLASNDATKGGIDLNSADLNLQIKRDGNGVPLPIDQQNLDNIRIDGLVPVILNIKPATSEPLFNE